MFKLFLNKLRDLKVNELIKNYRYKNSELIFYIFNIYIYRILIIGVILIFEYNIYIDMCVCAMFK